MTEQTIERKYVLTKIAKGDYLLPSNDGQILWRLTTYEDGPSHGLEEWTKDITLWAIRRWLGSLDAIDIDAWAMWEHVSDGYATRREAVSEALRLTLPKDH